MPRKLLSQSRVYSGMINANIKPFGQGDCEMHLPPNVCFGIAFTAALLGCKKDSEQNSFELYLSFRMTS